MHNSGPGINSLDLSLHDVLTFASIHPLATEHSVVHCEKFQFPGLVSFQPYHDLNIHPDLSQHIYRKC